MTIGIVGGSGDFGQGLGRRLEALGETVLLGSRNPRSGLVPNEVACAEGEIVFLSVPPEGVEDMSRDLAPRLAGKVLVSVASPIVFRAGRPGAEPGGLSLAERTARAAPEARVVAGFHTVSAKALMRVGRPLDEDVVLAGDDDEAKAVVGGLAERLVEGRAVDAGRLEVARWLEPVTAVLLNVNRRYKTESGIRITGIGG